MTKQVLASFIRLCGVPNDRIRGGVSLAKMSADQVKLVLTVCGKVKETRQAVEMN